ncbi:MAG: phosphate ABC transporter ATP-binding protein [Chloroflexi bacterium]|nr:phosphate ABC transporter ATP-binding protein [Chloroflexota bacterium]
MAVSLYRLENLCKSYDTRTVLDLNALDVHEGEILALVGPSGAGKSTLLRLLNFLEAPTSGTLAYRGQTIASPVPLDVRRQVTTVFQRPLLLRGSVAENVAYGLRLRGAHVNANVAQMLERVGLQDMAAAPARKLSGGEMQRVALARALVIEPRVLLLDEPTANLDPYNVTLIEEIVREQNRARGVTIVVVTHNIFQAKRLAHRVGLLLNGQLVEIADTRTFFEAPQDPRTAAFVRGELVY